MGLALPSLVLPCRCMLRSEKFVSLANLIADLGNFLLRRWVDESGEVDAEVSCVRAVAEDSQGFPACFGFVGGTGVVGGSVNKLEVISVFVSYDCV